MKCPYCNKTAKIKERVERNLLSYGGRVKARTQCCGMLLLVWPVTTYMCAEVKQEGYDDWGE